MDHGIKTLRQLNYYLAHCSLCVAGPTFWAYNEPNLGLVSSRPLLKHYLQQVFCRQTTLLQVLWLASDNVAESMCEQCHFLDNREVMNYFFEKSSRVWSRRMWIHSVFQASWTLRHRSSTHRAGGLQDDHGRRYTAAVIWLPKYTSTVGVSKHSESLTLVLSGRTQWVGLVESDIVLVVPYFMARSSVAGLQILVEVAQYRTAQASIRRDGSSHSWE